MYYGNKDDIESENDMALKFQCTNKTQNSSKTLLGQVCHFA